MEDLEGSYASVQNIFSSIGCSGRLNAFSVLRNILSILFGLIARTCWKSNNICFCINENKFKSRLLWQIEGYGFEREKILQVLIGHGRLNDLAALADEDFAIVRENILQALIGLVD